MSRRVLAGPPRAQSAAGAGAPLAEIDTYFDKVVKYILAGIYTLVVALIDPREDERRP